MNNQKYNFIDLTACTGNELVANGFFADKLIGFEIND